MSRESRAKLYKKFADEEFQKSLIKEDNSNQNNKNIYKVLKNRVSKFLFKRK